ncbi:MAG: tetratricopeptide repeat protein [Fimbriimonadaceae bacterium]|nr:tetratricopeptide repeat protein [Fimbriimonadaceae bacterium]
MSALRKATRQFAQNNTAPIQSSDQWVQTGLIAHQQGDLETARDSYANALMQQPEHFDALQLTGVTLLQEGRAQESLKFFTEALRVDPDHAPTWGNLATACMDCGWVDKAAAACREGLKSDPTNAMNWFNLGNALRTQGEPMDAVSAYENAIKFQPDFAPAWGNLADVYFGLHLYDSALEASERALLLDSNLTPALNTKGVTLDALDKPHEAQKCYRTVLEIAPDHEKAQVNLSNSLRAVGDMDGAANLLNAVLERNPMLPEAWAGFGNVLMGAGQPEDSVDAFDTAITLNPSESVYVSNRMMARQYGPMVSADDLKNDAIIAATSQGAETEFEWGQSSAKPKIAILSSDLRWHPVGQFLRGVLEAWPEDATVHLISLSERRDSWTERLRSGATSFEILPGGSPESQTEWLRQQNFDLAVDLNGYTSGHRLDLFAARIAPVQVSYLGFSGTTGIPTMDAFLADVIAAKDDAHFTERVVRADQSVYPLLELPDVSLAAPPRNETGHITFGAFVNPAKLNNLCLREWGEFVAPIPGARLILKNFAAQSEGFRNRVLEALGGSGLNESRVAFWGNKGFDEHLAAYNDIDFALDPFPYGGATTTAEALWMGTPVISWAGDRYTQRMALSVGEGTGAVLTPDDWETGLCLDPGSIRNDYVMASEPRGKGVADALIQLARRS